MRTYSAALAAILTSAVTAQTFRVAGTIVDSETAAPLERTRVVLTGGPVPEQSVTTADGRFSFDVPQGKYTLLASHRDYGESYGQTRSGNSDSAIVTGPDQDTTGIVMRWHAPVAIRGTVLDESGEPVHDATVELFVEAVTGGRKRVISLGRAESDELGDYSWSSIPAGTYYLAATGEPWYFSDPNSRQTLTAAGKSLVPYALTYYPGSNDPRGATPLILRPGAQLQADITLHPATGSNPRFVCVHAPCGGSVSLFAVGPRGVEALVGTATVVETGVIPGVPPGRYVARYTGFDGSMRKLFEVGGGDVTIQIAPQPMPTLAGKVVFQNPEDQPRHAVYVNLQDEDTGRFVTTALGANGSFSWPAVQVSRVRLSLAGADGFFVTRMSVDGAIVKDGVIDVLDGVNVQVNLTISRKIGRLKGFVMNGDKPAPAAMVVLALDGGSTDPYTYHGFQTDSDGSFDFAAIPAGEYVLFAVDNLEFEYTDLEAVRSYLSTGKRIKIEPNSVETESVGLTPAAHK
jgi:hypothetical protein